MTPKEAKQFIKLYREFVSSGCKVIDLYPFQEKVEIEVPDKAPAWMTDNDAAWAICCATS